MAEPKNLAAIREWVRENRKDIYPMFDQYIQNNGMILLLVIGFEAGRKFQNENPDMPLTPSAYLN